jgi:37-kD nucleoid-associated bacterial protein
LDALGEKSFAVLKHDDETVLAYETQAAAGGRRRVNLAALEKTFVQNKSALQKSALIRLKDDGGELIILDRRNQQKVARYFENFLDVVRVHEDADLTAKLVEVTRKVIKENRDLVPPQVYREVTKRTFDAATAGGKIDLEDQKSFLDTVMGRKLPDDDPLVAKYSAALRNARIDGIPVTLNSGKIVGPTILRFRTVHGIDIRAPIDLKGLIDTRGGRIVISDALDHSFDDTV